MAERPTCATCPWWHETTNNCHRHPPRVFVATTPVGDTIYDQAWPAVASLDWCGEHPAFAAWFARKGGA